MKKIQVNATTQGYPRMKTLFHSTNRLTCTFQTSRPTKFSCLLPHFFLAKNTINTKPIARNYTMEKKQDDFSTQTYAKQEELTKLMNDFTAAVLLHKPTDVYAFARDYFSTYHKVSADSHGSTKLIPVVVCGPSGVGKGTLIGKLLQEFPENFGFSVSHTTRKPREGEKDGVHYHFKEKDLVLKEISEGKFIEHAEIASNVYGTSKAAVDKVSESGKTCILDIDVQGAEQVKKANIAARYVFIAPPSFSELEKRLRGRGTETEEAIQKRLTKAKVELEYAKKPAFFDKIVVNDDLDKSYSEFKDWIFGNK